MAHEKEMRGVSGWLVVMVVLLVGAAAVWTMASFETVADGVDWIKVTGIAVLIVSGLCLAGLAVVNPNEASVVTLFGGALPTCPHPPNTRVAAMSTRCMSRC